MIMKYIITSYNNVAIGNEQLLHSDLATGVGGSVEGAGYIRFRNGGVEVYGSSIGYGIDAKETDATRIGMYLGLEAKLVRE